MAVKESRSNSNYGCNVEIHIGRMRIPKVDMMVTPVSDYNVLIILNNLARFGAEINCRKSTIYFPDYKVRIYCDGKMTQARSAIAKPQEKPDFPFLFPEVFVMEIPEELPPLYPILQRIVLKDPTKHIKTPVFKCPYALLGRFKDRIDKPMTAGILKGKRAPGGTSMFVQAKPDGRIRPLVDLRS